MRQITALMPAEKALPAFFVGELTSAPMVFLFHQFAQVFAFGTRRVRHGGFVATFRQLRDRKGAPSPVSASFRLQQRAEAVLGAPGITLSRSTDATHTAESRRAGSSQFRWAYRCGSGR